MEEIRNIVATVAHLLDSDPWEALRLANDGLQRATASENRPAIGLALRAMGAALVRCDQNVAAVECFDASIKIFEEQGDTFEAVKTRMNRVNAYLVLARFGEALADSALVTAVYRETGADHRLAKHLINTGHTLFRLDRFEEDLACLDEAEAILERLGERRELAYVYLNRAVALTALNRTDEALDFFAAAKAAARANDMAAIAAQSDYHVCYLHFMRGHYAKALQGLTRVRAELVQLGDRWHSALCDLDRAEIYLQLNLRADVLELASSARKAFDALQMPHEAAKATVFMAIANSSLGATAIAEALFDKSRNAFEAEGNTVWPAIIDLYKAALHLKTNQALKAAALAKQSFTVVHDAGLIDRAVHALILSARAALALDDTEEAWRTVARAQQIWRESPVASLAPELHRAAGDILVARNNLDSALQEYRRGLEELEWLRANIGPEEMRTTFLEDKLKLYESLLRVELKLQRPLEEVFDTMERAKSRGLLDLMARSADIGPTVRSSNTSDELRTAREEFNWYYRRIAVQGERSRSPDIATNRHLSQEARKYEAEVRRLTRDTALEPKTDPLRNIRPSTLAEVRKALPAKAALIEYYFVDEEILALVVRRDGVNALRRLSSVNKIRQDWLLLHFQLSRMSLPARLRESKGGKLIESTRRHLRELYEALVRPLGAFVADCESLVFVPHGFLHHVPFHALFDGTDYLLDRHKVTYAPSASVFRACMITTPARMGRPLLVGVADRHAPWIEQEIQQLKKLFPEADTFVGAAATHANFARHAENASIVHIAGHGRFRSDDALFSSIDLSDAPLNVFDAYGMRTSAELVVLSGCGTGMNRILPGDELLGLSRGFLYAGSPAVMVSLWDVNDARSADLMITFYRGLLAGHTKAESLQFAMMALREEEPHPYYWAPFVLIGRPF